VRPKCETVVASRRDRGHDLRILTLRCVLAIVEATVMRSQLEISDIAGESDDGVHRIARRGRAWRDLLGSRSR